MMRMKKFINEHLNGSEWYFKTEDSYTFLKNIGLKPKLDDVFGRNFPRTGVFFTSFSFWCGGKGTTTAWHTDMEDMIYLYVIKGRKRVRLLSPKFNDSMYPRKKYYLGSLWSEIDFLNPNLKKFPLYKNAVSEISEVTLNAGDALHIPRHWWHCVENLEPTVAITYCSYTHNYTLFALLPEIFRSLRYLFQPNVDSPE